MAVQIFENRFDAGRALARALRKYAQRPDVTVLALPRGGVPVGYEIAKELGAPLDVFIVRKLGVPGREELAMGAVASGGVGVLNPDVVNPLGLSQEAIQRVMQQELREVQRREQSYREGLEPLDLQVHTVILVDDGLATGSTMLAAVRALRQLRPARIVVAVPVASRQACEMLEQEADEVMCLTTPEPFFAVGQWYREFSQLLDDEVHELLARARDLVHAQQAAHPE